MEHWSVEKEYPLCQHYSQTPILQHFEIYVKGYQND
jgi:hypothetical protein